MAVNYKVSKLAIETLNEIIVGIDKLINEVSKSYTNIESCCESLSDLILGDLTGSIDTSELKSDNRDLSNYCSFLAKASILGYLQKLDNDKDMDKLQQSDLDIDLKFGYTGLSDKVLDCVEVISKSCSNESKVNGCIEAGLLANIRDISPEDYLSSGKMSDDILLVAELGNKSKPVLADDIIDFIKKNETYNKYYEDTVDEILGIYKYFLQDSFGLRPYEGVLSFSSPFLLTISDVNKLATQSNAKTGFNKVAKALNNYYDVIERSDRQFDIKALVTGSFSKPVYFPKKLIEYTMGRQLTYELSRNVYKQHSSSNSWDAYAKDYVEPQIREMILSTIYYALENNFKYSDFGNSKDDKSVDFTSDEFKDFSSKIDEIKLKTYLGSDKMQGFVKSAIIIVKKSLCSGVVVTKYNNLGSRVNSISIRVVDTVDNLKSGLTSTLFNELTTNSRIEFADGDLISDGKFTAKHQPLPFDIYEYRHDFDSALSNAEPLFGYKAVEMFKQRGVPISWNKILLGEDIKGTPIFASLQDSDDLPMQSNFVHNMMAGSRSGKGVMTMNIIASAIAEEKPVFYIDRKPDMAVMFRDISDGHMFIVNGGQYEGKNDPQGFFSDTGTAISGWDTAYDNMPDYLKTIFPTRSYAGNFGDYVYYRAMMFVLSIMVARVELSGNAEIYNNLGGADGFVAIFDEFKNWQTVFEQAFFSCQGTFGNKYRLSKNNFSEYNKADDDIKVKAAQLGTLDAEKKAAQIEKLNIEIDRAKEKKQTAISPLMAYCTTVMDKYAESRTHIDEKTSAGFKEVEGCCSDIFVIGQHIEIDGYKCTSEGMYPKRDSGLFNVNAETKDKSLMRGILDGFFHDWFMGYNEDGVNQKKYIGADKEGTPPNKWVTNQKYWAYINGAEMSSLRNKVQDSAVYFKPYLVLNNANEDDPRDPKKLVIDGEEIADPNYTFVAQCRKRVNDAVPGAELWETVRLKHLQDGLREQVTDENKFYGCLNEGIGFAGLANQTKQANGKGDFVPSQDLAKSEKIANYVANCMGYPTYQALLFDFSPNGLFSTRDVVRALSNPKEYATDLEKRLPIFYKYGLLGEDNDEVISDSSSFEESPYESDFMSSANTEEDDIESSETQSFDETQTFNEPFDDNDYSNDNDDGWYYEGDEDEGNSSSSDLPFTKEELAEALVKELAPNFSGVLKQKAIETVLELFKERGIEL